MKAAFNWVVAILMVFATMVEPGFGLDNDAPSREQDVGWDHGFGQAPSATDNAVTAIKNLSSMDDANATTAEMPGDHATGSMLCPWDGTAFAPPGNAAEHCMPRDGCPGWTSAIHNTIIDNNREDYTSIDLGHLRFGRDVDWCAASVQPRGMDA